MMYTLKKLEDKLLELGETLASPPSSDDQLYTLLDQIDSFLSRVEQSPSPSTWNALQLLMKTLTVKKILRHPDMDVRVAVASCISEITRITAPDAPYDDDVMKEIFQMIVGAFEGLGDMSSRSFQKRVLILETVAKVRSCVVMLDLECDALILDMFHHFLKTISNDHSENIFSSMEIIMTLVIEESEDISTELLSVLLNTLKKDKDEKDVLSISQRLAEKVVGNCANKIKSCLVELVQSTHAPLSAFNEVVASICQEDHKEENASGEVLEDDSKLSERTVSDELPQASAKMEQEVGCPEKVGTSSDSSPIVASSNGTVQMGNGDSLEQPSSPKQKSERSHRNGKSKNAVSDRVDCDNVESVVVKPDSRTDTKKAKGRKTNSSGPLTDTAVSSQVDSHKDEQTMTSRGKGHSKESDSSKVNDASTNEAEPAVSVDPEKKSDGSDNPTSVASPTESMPNSSRNKRGRRTGSKAAAKISDADAAAEQPVSSSLKDPSVNSQTDSEAIPLKGDEPKETEDIDEGDVSANVMSDSDVKPSRNSGKKGRSKRKFDHESSGRKPKSNNKQKKVDILGKDVDEEQSLKEMASSLRASSLKTLSAKPKSRKKRALGIVDISETLDRKKEPDERLVGSKIKVWWPDDEMFYEGVVDSYDPDTMKHKIVYSDGDVEVLLLTDERFELVKIDSEKGKRKAKGSASQTSLTKKMELSSNTLLNPPKSQTQRKSGTELSCNDAAKHSGRPRSGTSNVGKLSYEDSSETLKKSKGKVASNDKAKTPKSSRETEDEPVDETTNTGSKREESGNKSKDERKLKGMYAINDKAKTPKSSGKLKDDFADETPKTNTKREESGNKSVKKPKNETTKANTKSKDDTPKGGSSRSKVGDDKSKLKDSTPKTVNRIEGVVIGKDKTPKTTTKASNSKPKTGSDPKENGMSSEGKTKVGESENADVSAEAMTGAKKRKRKGRK